MEQNYDSYMEQKEYCQFWSRSDGFIHCLDCLFVGDCSTYDFWARFDPIDSESGKSDVTLEYCDDFLISG